MTEPRYSADTINDDALDQLYAERDAARRMLGPDDLRLVDEMVSTVEQHMARADRAEAERDGAYRERAHLVALLAAHYPSVIAPALDLDEADWWIVYLRLDGRQASWHISPRDAGLFAYVERVAPDDRRAQWDGHTTEQKYQHIGALSARLYVEARGLVETPLTPFGEAVRQMDADPHGPIGYARRQQAERAAAAASGPCPACRRADQAGLAPAEQHPDCTSKEQH